MSEFAEHELSLDPGLEEALRSLHEQAMTKGIEPEDVARKVMLAMMRLGRNPTAFEINVLFFTAATCGWAQGWKQGLKCAAGAYSRALEATGPNVGVYLGDTVSMLTEMAMEPGRGKDVLLGKRPSKEELQ